MSETPIIETQPMILCENLVKIYNTKDSEVLALQGLELTVQKGELVAIIGNSGSGKSTFLNMIGGLDRPSAGRLIVDGKDLAVLGLVDLDQVFAEDHGLVFPCKDLLVTHLPAHRPSVHIRSHRIP